MFNIEKAHFILDEMIMSGYITEANKANILNPVIAIVKSDQKWNSKTRRGKWRVDMRSASLHNDVFALG